MKTIGLEQTTLNACVEDAQRDRVILTRDGRPVALVVGLAELDAEQIELGKSEKFWKLVRQWRREKTVSQAELERRLEIADKACEHKG